MNDSLGNVDMDMISTSAKIFNEMTLVFGEIKGLLSSGNFQFDPGKTEFLSKKKDFFLLLNKVLCNKNIESFFPNTYNINHLKGLKNAEFSLIFDTYKLLELYFASQYTPLEKKVVVPKIQLLQILEVEEEYGWSYVSSLFGNENMFTSENCYEILQKFDFGQHNDEDLQIKMRAFRDFLTSKKSKDKELIRFVGFLVKSIRDYIEVKVEESKSMKEKEESQKRNGIVNEIFLNNLNFFDEFILWAKEHIGTKMDFNNIISLKDLHEDPLKYTLFLQFRKLFFSKYMENVVVPYKNLFEKNDKITERDYSTILRDLNNLGEAYDKDISESAFFMGLKKGFLLGDIYDFLYKQNQRFPDLAFHLTGLLGEEFTTYTTKLGH